MSKVVHNVTEKPDTVVSGRQWAGCTPGSCALRVHDAPEQGRQITELRSYGEPFLWQVIQQ